MENSAVKFRVGGGLGDSLRMVMETPLRSLIEKYGVEVFVSYHLRAPEKNEEVVKHQRQAWYRNAEGRIRGYFNQDNADLLKTQVFDLTPGFNFVSKKEWDDLSCPEALQTPPNQKLKQSEFLEGYDDLERYLPLDLRIDTPNPHRGVRNIGIQLSSAYPKTFRHPRWDKLICRILEKYKYTHIYLFDPPESRPIVEGWNSVKDKRVHLWEDENSFAYALSMIPKMDLVISPDSYSKYICFCNRVPAILLCCALPYTAPGAMLYWAFGPWAANPLQGGICFNDNFKILGIEYEEKGPPNPDTGLIRFKVISAKSHIHEIKVEEVLALV